MRRAIKNLEFLPEHVLVDARRIPDILCPQTSIIKGDRLSFSIASASIIAKTYRDRLMNEYDREFPCYGFKHHKGYPTSAHREAIRRFGTCSIHRRSFRLLNDKRREFDQQPSLFPDE